MISKEFKPGESKVFRLNGGALGVYWKKGKSAQVGFFFAKSPTEKAEIFWGEILPIDNLIEKQLLKEQKMR